MATGDMLPDELTAQFLRNIQRKFYASAERQFFQERNLLLQALTFPAAYLHQRGVKYPADRYKEILTTIIRTINTHGNLAEVRSPGRYLLHAVQTHMQHHGEDYYTAAVRTRSALADVMLGLTKAKPGAIQSDSTVPALAEVHRVLSAAKGSRRKPVAPIVQPDLFASAHKVQTRRTLPRDSV